MNRQVFTYVYWTNTVPGRDRCPSRPTGSVWLETPRPRPSRVTDAGVFAQSANTQIYTRFKLRICWSTKVVVLRQPKSYGSKSLSGITHSNHKQKRAITVINKYGARHILLAVVRGERLNHWFPLDKRQNSSGLANSRAFYIKLATNVIE